jgi:hypothetical protein
MRTKFESFIHEYQNNHFCVCTDIDDETIKKLIEENESWLFITNTMPGFVHERLFLSILISDNLDEIYRYFEEQNAEYIAMG